MLFAVVQVCSLDLIVREAAGSGQQKHNADLLSAWRFFLITPALKCPAEASHRTLQSQEMSLESALFKASHAVGSVCASGKLLLKCNKFAKVIPTFIYVITLCQFSSESRSLTDDRVIYCVIPVSSSNIYPKNTSFLRSNPSKCLQFFASSEHEKRK